MHLILAQGFALPPDTPWTAVVVVAILLIAAPVIKVWMDNRVKQTEAQMEEVKAEAAQSQQSSVTLGKQTDALVEMVRNQTAQTQTLSSMSGELRAHTTALTGNTEKLGELGEDIGELHRAFEIAFKAMLTYLQSPKGDPEQVKLAVFDLKAAVASAVDSIAQDEAPPTKEAETLMLAIENTSTTAKLARKTGEIETSKDDSKI